MKRIQHIVFSVSLLALCLMFSKPANCHAVVHSNGITATAGNITHYLPQPIPDNTRIQIRHRSPHEVEKVAVPDPSEHILYTIRLTELEKEFLSKWETYFYVQNDKLPLDQAYPPTRSLRAPPVSC